MLKKTMTIKQIADLLGKGETTLRRWIQSAEMASLSAKMAEAQKTKKPAEFNLDEIIYIVKSNGNETLASLLKDNAEKTEKPTLDFQSEMIQLMKSQVEITKDLSAILKTLKPVNAQISQAETQTALPSPSVKISNRVKFNDFINELSHATEKNQQECYRRVYSALSKHLGKNIKANSEKQGISKIEYLDSLNRWEEVFSILDQIFLKEIKGVLK